jgi:hypothetical protein
MSETTNPDVTTAVAPSRFDRFVAKYRADHQNPVNSFLHLGVGWPMCAAAVILLPFRPLWSIALVIVGYVFMFAGHFLFEGNTPTILKHPTTPFVIAWAVIRGLVTNLGRLATGTKGR